jgi:hypothetical protein
VFEGFFFFNIDYVWFACEDSKGGVSWLYQSTAKEKSRM